MPAAHPPDDAAMSSGRPARPRASSRAATSSGRNASSSSETAPDAAGQQVAPQVDVEQPPRDQHDQRVLRRGVQERPQRPQHRGAGLDVVEVVDHHRRPGGQLLAQDGGAVLRREAVLQEPAGALRRLRVDRGDRRREVGREAPRAVVGLPQRQPRVRARAGAHELGDGRRLAGAGGRHHQQDAPALGGLGERPEHPRPLDGARADGGDQGLRGDESARVRHRPVPRSGSGCVTVGSRALTDRFATVALQTPGPAPMDIA